MSTKTERVSELGAQFRLDDWVVEPSLNRISRGGSSVQLESKAMDVLVYLVGRAGEVASHAELQDAVWQTEFVAYNTVANRIKELRDALEDDARNPRYIETIPKRGYRLIAAVHVGGVAETDAGALVATEQERPDERSPYPGLAPFSEEDAEDFFGREAEIAALWRKITSRRLLAVIGASGAGKSSLLRAGVVARTPPGWRALVCQPGEAPILELARALAPEFTESAEEVQELLRFQDPDVALAMVSRWRGRWENVLVVVDQFEEVYTLSTPRVQDEYVALLRRLVDAAGIHLVLVLRDDFLIECHRFPALEPILKDLTLVGPPVGAALRRALTEPAARRHYGFENGVLVDEMVGEVEAERGALPLLAFAVSRLWELRDPERRLLTREAYERIGGVGGALAQHAEATLEGIGEERLPVVRELFRNLVTAQGTRAVRDVDELLSVFDAERMPLSSRARRPKAGESRDRHRLQTALPPSGSLHASGDPSTPRPSEGRSAQDDRKTAAAGILRTLIDARLLTSFRDVAGEADTGGSRHRVEIVHESLLINWPRLVRWQTQDADAAQLRDQLRQAAKTWDERGRTDDLLWTGSAYREYAVWRERYPGGLSELEEAFAAAMASLASRRRRRRRIALATGFAVLLAVLAVVGTLWRRSVQETRRAEAAKLLALAQARLADDPTEALALTTASLEVADTREAREFVMRTLWTAPPALELEVSEGEQLGVLSFSPDGHRVAVSGLAPEVKVWSEDGQGPTLLPGHPTSVQGANVPIWAAQGLLVTGRASFSIEQRPVAFGDRVQLWSIPDGRLLRVVDFGLPGYWQLGAGRLFVRIVQGEGAERQIELRSWKLPDGPEELLDRLSGAELDGISDFVAAPDGSGWVVARGREVFFRPFEKGGRESLLEALETEASLAPFGEASILASDKAGNARLRSFGGGEPGRAWAIRHPAVVTGALPDPAGRRLASLGPHGQFLQVWQVAVLPGAGPLELRRSGTWFDAGFAFHPTGEWCVATTHNQKRLSFWPLASPHPAVVEAYVFPRYRRPIAFTPDSRWLATGWGEETVRLLPVRGGEPDQTRELSLPGSPQCADLRFDAERRILLLVSFGDAWIVPLDGGPSRQVAPEVEGRQIESGAISPSGNRIATATLGGEGALELYLFDLTTGALQRFALPRPATSTGIPEGVNSLEFLDEQTLLTAGWGGLRRWDLASGTQELVVATDGHRQMRASRAAGIAVHWDWASDLSPGLERLELVELASWRRRTLEGFGDDVEVADLDPSGTVLATGHRDGTVRVGRLDGGEAHLLLSHDVTVARVAVSPDLRWVASSGEDNSLRLWPMPDLTKPPLHTLPHDELLAKLHSLTNLRAVRDATSDTGWTIELGPFPGWRDVPTW